MNQKETKSSLNYIYFGLLFVSLAFIQVYHVLLIGFSEPLIANLYMSVAILESAIEVAILSWISVFLLSRKLNLIHTLYLCAISLFFLLRFVDFAIVRLMDVSVWRWIELVFQETLRNFIEMMHAANINLTIFMIILLGLIGVIASSYFFFRISNRICKKKPYYFSSKKAISCCLLSFLALGIVDVFLYMVQVPTDALRYSKALPWKRTLLDARENIIEVKGYLKISQTDVTSLDEMDSNLFSLERKPDLFLFVVESLRDDFLTENVSPNLVQFRNENCQFAKSLSVANGTHKSWFSLFYSLYPFYWTKYQPIQWNQGGVPLTLLKKMGYQINVYASSRLNYYAMDEVLFGKKGHLIDHLHEFRSEVSLSASKTDSMAIEKLCLDIKNSDQKGGRVFIVFLESTHFDYSWPEDQKPLFSVVKEKIDYMEMVCNRRNLDDVKNRYRNAVHYVDELFGSFEKTLKEKEFWNDSVIVFTADHGEEFNEHGCIFHASSLSLPQLKIPLYIKLGQDQIGSILNQSRMASQMDIFPTFFHYIVGENSLASLFQGESLFGSQKKSFTLGARYNASQAPYEFYIQKGGYRLILEFCNQRDIFHSRFLKVKSILDEKEESIPFSHSFVQNQFGEILDQLFSLP